jgi:repressor LexA
MDIGKDLTKRQQEIFDFIKKYSAKYGYPPTVRDIGKAVGLASSSTVHAHLANLEKIGLLRRVGGDEGEYVLTVRGDSMVNAGIFAGDLVVVRPQDTADDGDIVVALLGEDATVKRFFRENDHVRLQPENDTMEPIRSREVQVLGRVVGVLRKVA